MTPFILSGMVSHGFSADVFFNDLPDLDGPAVEPGKTTHCLATSRESITDEINHRCWLGKDWFSADYVPDKMVLDIKHHIVGVTGQSLQSQRSLILYVIGIKQFFYGDLRRPDFGLRPSFLPG